MEETKDEVLTLLEDRRAPANVQRRQKMTPAEEIKNRYTYHQPFGNQQERYSTLRELARDLAHGIHVMCPDSREKATAQTRLQEVVMWANASIAINEQPPDDPQAKVVQGVKADAREGVATMADEMPGKVGEVSALKPKAGDPMTWDMSDQRKRG